MATSKATSTKSRTASPQAKKAAPKVEKNRKPTTEETAMFWDLVDTTWARAPEVVQAARVALVGLPLEELEDGAITAVIDEALPAFLEALTDVANEMTADELVAMDRVVERLLYDIDREDIHEATDGSDDGFLYARGYIVAMGQRFYDAVVKQPERAIMDAECEEICYFFANTHNDRFDKYPKTGSGISRETGSNPDGWG